MPVISDLELKKRLEAHNYQVPPITESTKKVLLKKLSQLDKEANHSKSSKLNEYSSADEDASSNPSPYLRRRKVVAPTPSNNANSANGSGRTSHRTSVASSSSNNNRRQSQLLQISDQEDEEDSNQTSDSDDDDEDEDDEEITAANIALQTSLNSTLNQSPPSPINGKNVSTNGARKGQRFSANSPSSPVRSTASYLNSQSPVTSTPMAFPPNSPLRKAVAKNASAFGSLGRYFLKCGFNYNS